VIGPKNIFYIVDHHHRAAALLKIGKDKMIVQVLKTARTIDLPGFWSRMVKNNLAFLYDEQGRGPRSPADLPESIDRLKDDPYRSLAWAVREAGGYRKTEVPFAEFQWAQFFRARIEIDPGLRVSNMQWRLECAKRNRVMRETFLGIKIRDRLCLCWA
jgi:hypothetical protein